MEPHIRQYFLIWSAPGYKYGAKLFVYVEGCSRLPRRSSRWKERHAGQLDSDGTRTKPEEEVKTPNSKDKFVSRDRPYVESGNITRRHGKQQKSVREGWCSACAAKLSRAVQNVFELFGADTCLTSTCTLGSSRSMLDQLSNRQKCP